MTQLPSGTDHPVLLVKYCESSPRLQLEQKLVECPPTNPLHRGRKVVERSFNRLKHWRGIAMRSDKTARNYHAGVRVAAILIWINTDLFNTG